VFVSAVGGCSDGKGARGEGTGVGVSTVAESGGSEAIETGGSGAVAAGVAGT
jgi:hypothetical protein